MSVAHPNDCWRTDISNAPKGKRIAEQRFNKRTGKMHDYVKTIPQKVILAFDCGTVTVSHWIYDVNDQGRWNFASKGQEPVKWMPFPTSEGAS